MKILLVNANTFGSPPCIPIGLEYAAAALLAQGHDVKILDMFQYNDPLAELDRVAREESFDIAGVSLRNIDTAQFARFQFFVPAARMVVQNLNRAGLRVVLGGAGFSAMPEAILDYTGADWGISGPAELVLPGFLNGGASAERPRIVNAWCIGGDPDIAPERGVLVRYDTYIREGGVVGFATQYGCPGACVYCIEAGTPVFQRGAAAVVEELRMLREKGFTEYHLCDSEFNHSLDYCGDFLDRLSAAELGMNWALYMKPAPSDAALFRKLARTGASTITLSVEAMEADSPGGSYTWDDVALCVREARAAGIRMAIDLSLGLPDEPEDAPARTFDFFRRERPDIVNVNSIYRVYGGTPLEKLLRRRPDLHEFLTDALPPGPPLEKLFFIRLHTETLRGLIAGDPLFKLEGFDPGTNYEILGK